MEKANNTFFELTLSIGLMQSIRTKQFLCVRTKSKLVHVLLRNKVRKNIFCMNN